MAAAPTLKEKSLALMSQVIRCWYQDWRQKASLLNMLVKLRRRLSGAVASILASLGGAAQAA
jgi:hypothetical protein